MASKKVQIFVEETEKQLAKFNTRTLTKLFKKDELRGHTVDILMQEPGHGKAMVGKYVIQGDDTTDPGADKAPVVDAGDDIVVKEGQMVTLDASAHDDGKIIRSEWFGPDFVHDLTPDPNDPTLAHFMAPMLPEGMDVRGLIFFFEAEDDKANMTRDSCIVTITKDGQAPPECPPDHIKDPDTGKCIPKPSPVGDVIYDSLVNSNLHDGKVEVLKKVGNITPGGMGWECRASGNPRIVKKADGTFSLVVDSGHGRIYGYILNYDNILEVTYAWLSGDGDCSLKMRSQHNEGGDCSNRFGGYGFALDHKAWDGKREICHNIHDQSKSGSLPTSIDMAKYVVVQFSVEDVNGKVVQKSRIDYGDGNWKDLMDKTDDSPEPYMVNRDSFGKQSYLWIRQNASKTSELNIKRVRVLKKA